MPCSLWKGKNVGPPSLSQARKSRWSLIPAGLSAAGFQKPSPVQQAAIPLARAGLDVLVQAKSGTGKTAVFGVACLEGVKTDNKLPQASNNLRIEEQFLPVQNHYIWHFVCSLLFLVIQALIVAPTREIALQIAEVIRFLASKMPRPAAEVGAFIGGLPIEQDQKVLRRCTLLACTHSAQISALSFVFLSCPKQLQVVE